MKEITGYLVDVDNREVFPARLRFSRSGIKSIERIESCENQFIMPGFIDSHIHIESSMLVPSEFAKMAVQHGTVATVSDPHEIANVLGKQGVRYMIENGKTSDFKFFFGVPSCVPATTFETAGAELTAEDIEELFEAEDLLYLSEMMNYPGVIFDDPQVVTKLAVAHKFGKPIDGHAPALRGQGLKKYVAAGISTDHECVRLDEAEEKISLGMKILIRQGSAAKNFEALHPLLNSHPDQVMFCSDDKHPDDLLLGHINAMVKRALSLGYDFFNVLRAACLNPILHYQLPVGRLHLGDDADFIVVNNLTDFEVLQTYIAGKKVFDTNKPIVDKKTQIQTPNKFSISTKTASDFAYLPPYPQAIVALDGEIVTEKKEIDGQDVLKIAVVCRYREQPVACAWIKGFGLKDAAIASCVAHDSHNIVAVGDSDELLCKAVNLIVEAKGGISLASHTESMILPLPVAGIMSNKSAQEVGRLYLELERAAKRYGTQLKAPFMTLSFMALPVIPKLKLTDKGLFDVEKFVFVEP